jgi:hypothetical protein
MILEDRASKTLGKSVYVLAGNLLLIRFIYPLLNSHYDTNLFIVSRYYVHEDIFDAFISMLANYARSLKVGNPLDKNTKMGPVVSKQHYEKVMSYINLAVKNNHRIVCGETIE